MKSKKYKVLQRKRRRKCWGYKVVRVLRSKAERKYK